MAEGGRLRGQWQTNESSCRVCCLPACGQYGRSLRHNLHVKQQSGPNNSAYQWLGLNKEQGIRTGFPARSYDSQILMLTCITSHPPAIKPYQGAVSLCRAPICMIPDKLLRGKKRSFMIHILICQLGGVVSDASDRPKPNRLHRSRDSFPVSPNAALTAPFCADFSTFVRVSLEPDSMFRHCLHASHCRRLCCAFVPSRPRRSA